MDSRSAGDFDRQLGEQVRLRRLEIGMSQERLAQLLGVTFQQVQKYEKGVNRIAASRLFDIAAALDVPVNRFFEALAGATPFSVNCERPKGADELLRLYGAIPSVSVRRRVIDLVRVMAAEGE
ncbi:helix-turn-helix transcriptional regulator [Terricaulis sp.]|uniref:helix-turn-helix domain-containing protein n=1 Tax=Terricaulis sp. TaxID=2768686 RepID=UPI002AC3EE76|nr:helix-turn-helix transcriptional regulator [Terricaulis sp.]MDZ4690972.1 helix-turn-helix transcriptional regulator [Terricaulis sp.]